MNINITDKSGITLKTQGKYMPEDVSITIDESLLGIDVSDTYDADATPSDMRAGKTAYVKNEKIEGVLEDAADDTYFENIFYTRQDNTLTINAARFAGFLNMNLFRNKIMPDKEFNIQVNNVETTIVDGDTVVKLSRGDAYDGSTFITGDTTIDVKALIDQKRIPLTIKVNTTSGGESGELVPYELSLKARMYGKNSYPNAFYLMAGDNRTNMDFLENLDFSKCTTFRYMFKECYNITTIPLLDTSEAKYMESMFESCNSLITIPQLNTSKVTGMSQMFKECKSLSYIPLINTSKVIYINEMFKNCKALVTIPNLDFSSINGSTNMFEGCVALESIPPLKMSNSTSMNQMFSGCSSLKTIPTFDIPKVTSMSQSFYGCSALTYVSALDTANVTSMSYLFKGCSVLTTVEQLNMIKVTSPTNMFDGCTNLTNLTLLNIKANLTVGSGSTYGHLLTVESLIGLCQECIKQSINRTLTVGSANITKLSTVYVKLTGEAELDSTLPKLPMVQCESTDEGAMLVADYMALKQWSLA